MGTKSKDKLKHRDGCLNCPHTEDILAMDTVLYQGFGGYHVTKNGKLFYMGNSNDEWESFKKLSQIERQAKKEPKSHWRVVLNNPLRGATWRRNIKGQWILIETNQGFA